MLPLQRYICGIWNREGNFILTLGRNKALLLSGLVLEVQDRVSSLAEAKIVMCTFGIEIAKRYWKHYRDIQEP
jgi:hypothetical protein